MRGFCPKRALFLLLLTVRGHFGHGQSLIPDVALADFYNNQQGMTSFRIAPNGHVFGTLQNGLLRSWNSTCDKDDEAIDTVDLTADTYYWYNRYVGVYPNILRCRALNDFDIVIL